MEIRKPSEYETTLHFIAELNDDEVIRIKIGETYVDEDYKDRNQLLADYHLNTETATEVWDMLLIINNDVDIEIMKKSEIPA